MIRISPPPASPHFLHIFALPPPLFWGGGGFADVGGGIGLENLVLIASGRSSDQRVLTTTWSLRCL